MHDATGCFPDPDFTAFVPNMQKSGCFGNTLCLHCIMGNAQTAHFCISSCIAPNRDGWQTYRLRLCKPSGTLPEACGERCNTFMQLLHATWKHVFFGCFKNTKNAVFSILMMRSLIGSLIKMPQVCTHSGAPRRGYLALPMGVATGFGQDPLTRRAATGARMCCILAQH